MAYSERARELRRCKAIKADGTQCRGWALWGGELCASHTYKTHQPRWGAARWQVQRSKAVCRCAAYSFPHRPGAGLCRWPDEPTHKLTTPPGTPAWWRGKGGPYARTGESGRIVKIRKGEG